LENNHTDAVAEPVKKGTASVRVIKGRDYQSPVKKSDASNQLSTEEFDSAADWIEPDYNIDGLDEMVSGSSIIPQCISAYGANIPGFGLGVRYREDFPEETEEMKSEWDYAKKVIDLLNVEHDTKEIFEQIVHDRERFGISYLECIRNIEGVVVEVLPIEDTSTVRKSKLQNEYTDYEYWYQGDTITRKKRFRRYKQTVGARVVYFKEFGDPRMMNRLTGEYLMEGEDAFPFDAQANEILEFKVGKGCYGEVRWIGQVLGVDGSRSAEKLNNNYFRNGRHTPMMIVVKGGTLTDESFVKLQEYMDAIRGESGQHAFMVLEAENADTRAAFENTKQPEIEVKDLASMLQKDELFQGYLDNNRRRVQSSFRLPDIYVAYTTDYNRATAQAAMEVTERQVFQPERASLAWSINNKLFNAHHFRFVEIFFEDPDITNPDDMYKMLTIAGTYGGITPNKAKQIGYTAIGEDSEDYEGDWADVPLKITELEHGASFGSSMFGGGMYLPSGNNYSGLGSGSYAAADENAGSVAAPEEDETDNDDLAPVDEMNLAAAVDEKIAKELVSATTDNAVVAVMKEVKALILKMQEDGGEGAESGA